MNTNKSLDDLLATREFLYEKLRAKEQEIEELNSELTLLDKTLIPEFMEDLGISSFTTASGKVYKITTNYFPKIVDQTLFAKCALQDDMLKNRIKMVYTVPLKDLNCKESLKQTVFEKFGVILDENVSIHPQTLKSYIRNVVENNLQIPEGLAFYSEKKITTNNH